MNYVIDIVSNFVETNIKNYIETLKKTGKIAESTANEISKAFSNAISEDARRGITTLKEDLSKIKMNDSVRADVDNLAKGFERFQFNADGSLKTIKEMSGEGANALKKGLASINQELDATNARLESLGSKQSLLKKEEMTFARAESKKYEIDDAITNGGDPTRIAVLKAEYDKLIKKIQEYKAKIAEVDALEEKRGGLQSQIDDATSSMEKFDTSITAPQTRLRQIRQELAMMIANGETGTARFAELSEQARGLSLNIRSASASSQTLAQSLQGVASGVGGTFATVTGAMALFGDETAKSSEVQTKLQSAISITVGLQSMQNLQVSLLAFKTGLLTKAVELETKAEQLNAVASGKSLSISKGRSIANSVLATGIKGLAGVTKVASVALKALTSPIGLLVTALGFAIYKIATFKTETEKMKDELRKSNEEYTKSIISETTQLDVYFKRLENATKGTKEYEVARQDILNKYGNYLNALDNEKDRLDNIALAYKTVREELVKTAKAKAMEKGIEEASAKLAESRTENRQMILDKVRDKYGDQTDENGEKLSEVNYKKLVSFIEGGQEETDDIKKILSDFDYLVTSQYNTYIANSMRGHINTEKRSKKLFEDTLHELQLLYGDEDAAMTSAGSQAVIDNETNKTKAIIALQRQAEDEILNQRKMRTKNIMAQIDLEYEAEKKGIERAKEKFLKDFPNADTAEFDSQLQRAKENRDYKKAEQNKRDEREVQSIKFEGSQRELDIQISAQERMVELAGSVNSQIEERTKLYELNLKKQISAIENEKALRMAEIERTHGKDSELYKSTEADFDGKISQAKYVSDLDLFQKNLSDKINSLQNYASKRTEIENNLQSTLISIDDEARKLEEQKEQRAISDKTYGREKQMLDTRRKDAEQTAQGAMAMLEAETGMTPEAFAGVMNEFIETSVALTQEGIQTQVLRLEKELAKTMSDTSEDGLKKRAKLQAVITVLKGSIQRQEAEAQKENENESDDELKEQNKKIKNYEKIQESISTATSLFRSMGGVVRDVFGDEAGDAMDMIGAIGDFTNGIINAVKMTTTTAYESMSNAEKASFILTIISTCWQILNEIMNIAMQYTEFAMIGREIEYSQRAVSRLKNEYTKLEMAINKIYGTQYFENQRLLIENLEKQNSEYEKQLGLAREQARLASSDKKKEQAEENMAEAEQNAIETQQRIEEVKQNIRDSLLTTDLRGLAQSFAEAIVEGFQEGARGMEEAWDKVVDNLQKSILTKMISTRMESMLQPIFEEMNQMADDGSISEAELAKIGSDLSVAKETSMRYAETMKGVAEQLGILDDAEQNATAKSIQSMSQNTAEELAGRFTAIQISTADIDTKMALLMEQNASKMQSLNSISIGLTLLTGVVQEQLNVTKAIGEHTAQLSEMNDRLRKIDENTRDL